MNNSQHLIFNSDFRRKATAIGGPLGSNGEIGRDEALLLWSAHMTSVLRKSYSAALLYSLSVNKVARRLTLER